MLLHNRYLLCLVLLNAVFGADVSIIERYTWGASSGPDTIPTMKKITDIVIGNDVSQGTLGCVDRPSCMQLMTIIQERDKRTGQPDLKFNFYVSSQGLVFEGRGWTKEGGFTEIFAPSSVGIAYLGDWSDGLTDGAKAAIKSLIKLGYEATNIQLEFCLMFTCDTALQLAVKGPSCPGGSTYLDLKNWEPLPNVKPKHVNRPCGCGKLDDPTSGTVTYASYAIDSTATYACKDGFELIGENKRTCGVSGAWSDVTLNPPQCVDPKRGLIIVPKKVWDVVNSDISFISGGFPIATLFVGVEDAFCVDDSDCRSKLKELKKAAWDTYNQKDVLCNFYIAKTGIVYEGRGWGVKGAYNNGQNVEKTQGICFLGETAVTSKIAVDSLFNLVEEAQDTMRLDVQPCFLTGCSENEGTAFCKAVTKWMNRDNSDNFCETEFKPDNTRAKATKCRHDTNTKSWLNYEGTTSTTVSGCQCQYWSDYQTTQHHFYPEAYPYAHLDRNYCRNPNMDENGPWCITREGCGSTGRDTCRIPQCEGEYCFATPPYGCQTQASYCFVPLCPPAVSFDQAKFLSYTLNRPRDNMYADTDKMTINFKSNNLNSRLMRIEGDEDNFWEIALIGGKIVVKMVLSHGNATAALLITGTKQFSMGSNIEIQIFRKNHRVILLTDGVVEKFEFTVNTTVDSVQFLRPKKYLLGSSLLDYPDPFIHVSSFRSFDGCMTDVTFNNDNLLGVATNPDDIRGELITEPSNMVSSGCMATLPFDWGNFDTSTPAAPVTTPKKTDGPNPGPNPTEEGKEVSDSGGDNLAFIIIGIVLVIIIIIVIIGCIFFKRYNRDKGVYNVDEAKTTKWDWKKGIIPVMTEEKRTNGDYNTVQNDESPEIFA